MISKEVLEQLTIAIPKKRNEVAATSWLVQQGLQPPDFAKQFSSSTVILYV